MSRQRVLALLVLIAIAAGAWWLYARPSEQPAETDTTGAADVEDTGAISASATLLPERYGYLAARAGGRVQSIAVEAGQTVAAGALLIQLGDAELKAAVSQAEAGLAAAQANLARLKAGARREQLAQAEAGVAAAQANLARLKAGARPEQLTQAQAGLSAAQARLAQAHAGVRSEQIAVAQAQVRQAETALARAQDLYDRNRWVGGETERELMYQRDAAGAALATARAQLAAQQAPTQAEDIAAAQAQTTQAQAQLDLVKAGATVDEIAAAEAQVAQAHAQLDLLLAGATTDEIAAAQANVDAAGAVVDQARAVLAEATIRAPFAGVVTAVAIRTGEIAAPAQPLVTLADLSTLHLETDDLSETVVTSIRPGQQVQVAFEALPARALQGKVTRVASMSSLKQGGTNYTVTIVLDRLDPALRWGMTARVEIDTAGGEQ